MEVPGKVDVFRADNPKLHCLPCRRDGLNEPAHGYCQDCQEHLCKTCFQHHTRPTPMRNHILLDKDAMPQQQTTDDVKPDDITEFCSKHKDKLLEFYCNDHQSVACYVCITLDHKQCKADYIPDVSGNVSDELRNLFTRMEALVKKCKSNIRKAQACVKILDQSHEKAIEEIRLFRKEINAHLDHIESRMINEAASLVQTSKHKLKKVEDSCLEIAEELKCSKTSLDNLSENNKLNKLFIEMKNVGPRVVALTSKERQTLDENRTDDSINFVPNERIMDQLKLENNLGKIYTSINPSADRALHLQYEKTIDVKSSSNKEICDISGMVLVSSSQLVVADWVNKKIKMTDTINGKLISEINVSSPPRDVIKLPNNKLAVALKNEKCIQIMSYTDTSLSLHRRLDVGEVCYCLAFCQGKLVAGCNSNPGKLVILDLNGNVMQIYDTPKSLNAPEKIIVSRDEKFLYVSDYYGKNSRCVRMDWQGNILQKFALSGYEGLRGIQEMEDGTLMVCYYISHNIVRLSSSFERCEIRGFEKGSIQYPWALLYSEQDNKLYASCSSGKEGIKNDIIKVFHLHWQ